MLGTISVPIVCLTGRRIRWQNKVIVMPPVLKSNTSTSSCRISFLVNPRWSVDDWRGFSEGTAGDFSTRKSRALS
ncbi:hypothetical protein SuNHUV7_14510 (plasmid) [Pseudoseohaeicola sp. NH-UV-7]